MASETENYNMEICPTILTNRYLAPPLIFGLLMASPSVFSVTFDQVQSDIFDVSCASSSCHGGSRNPTLTSGQSFANIVNVASTQGTDYVEPGDPDQSYIMNKVLGTGVGGQMPPSGALSDAKIQLLRDWIAQGASSGLYLGRSYQITSSQSPNLSETHIINSSGSAQAFTGTLYHKSGDQLGAANVALHAGTINSQGRVILSATDLQTLFDVDPWTGPAILDIQGTMEF
ncbi:MAG: c-type cytochrome domain-containing protein, partial [Pseudomonadales bacterium]